MPKGEYERIPDRDTIEREREATEAKIKKEKEDEALKRPRSLFQKFLFVIVTLMQATIVYMIQKDIDFGLPALRPNPGGKILFHYMLLIYGSFILSCISFITTCILSEIGTSPNPNDLTKEQDRKFRTGLIMAIDASIVSVQTALVNAVGSSSLGATGDLVTVLKYLIQYQVLIVYLNVGMNWVFSQHVHFELPEIVQIAKKTINKIEEFFICYFISPIVWLSENIMWIITTPFVKLFELILYCVGIILSPLRYFFLLAIYYVGWGVYQVGRFFHWIWDSFVNVILISVDYIMKAFDWTMSTLAWLWVTLVVNPAIWVWENVFVSTWNWILEKFECIAIFVDYAWRFFKACYRLLYAIPDDTRITDTYGWIEKQGNMVKSWKTRFYTLRRGVFSYYEKMAVDKSGQNLKGEIDLRLYNFALIEDRQMRLISLNPNPEIDGDKGRVYYIKATSMYAADSLVNALNAQIKYAKGHSDVEYY